METYQEFLDRIYSFEKKKINFGRRYFKGNPSISQKVDKDNTFRNFYGDTIVFALDDGTKQKLDEYVDLLYRAVPGCFCERLVSDTFHVTLHDFSNSPDLKAVEEEMAVNERKVMEKMEELQKSEMAKTTIKVKSTYLFNMVDTSLVLGLYPADEEEYRRLMELYYTFDTVKKLSYPFTPHITFAYYNVNGFDLQAAGILEDAVNQLNDISMNKMEIELNVSRLYYQKFKSMNDYFCVAALEKIKYNRQSNAIRKETKE